MPGDRKPALRKVLRVVAWGASILALVALCGGAGVAYAAPSGPSDDDISAVVTAQKGSTAVTQATNGCPLVGGTFFGWPGDQVQKCQYKMGPKANAAEVYLLKLEPQRIALWIESACNQLASSESNCFVAVLNCAFFNSGMMFPVSGNLREAVNDNLYFRNGITTRWPKAAGVANGDESYLSLDDQEKWALVPVDQVPSMKTGLARLWRTTPQEMSKAYPESGAPADSDTYAKAQLWLSVVQKEMLAAITSDSNRLLLAWMMDHPKGLAQRMKDPKSYYSSDKACPVEPG